MAVTRIEDVVNKDDGESGVPAPEQQDPDGRLATVGKKRTRTGCLNCRRKRRKCDENKPTCEGCQARKEFCEWGVKVSFRPEHAQTMGPEHPSMRQAIYGRAQSYQIINVTKEVIRDYFEETGSEDVDEMRVQDVPLQSTPPIGQPLPTIEPTVEPIIEPTFEAVAAMQEHLSHQPSPVLVSPELTNGTPYISNIDLFLSPQHSDGPLEDGIFLPGSQYQELHAALRSRIIDTARSTAPSRIASPEIQGPELDSPISIQADDDESRRLAHLTAEEEYVLWQNYIEEVSPWLDKFDINRHFELVLPMMAKSHPHLRYSILALSARQMELKAKKPDNSCSLALYQHAIHLLSPLLHQRTSVVLGSCLVLCVLEMMSCSPKAWRRHLDGCAALIQALGISGGCGGLDQALFWCFARMDICGGLISSERTLIPMTKWMSAGDLLSDYTVFQHSNQCFDMYANRAVYLCGQVVDLLCTSGKWEQRHTDLSRHMDASEYIAHWTRLFEVLERWYQDRPEEMKPLLTIPSPATPGNPTGSHNPFQTLLYGNGPAVSGNQLYHTAALLMLKYRPSHIQFAKKPHSILWHARQICAISLSNNHHGCWTNSIQPLWVAGQHMSHPSEHEAILEIYKRIERETGWATEWRAQDLREYWGELDD